MKKWLNLLMLVLMIALPAIAASGQAEEGYPTMEQIWSIEDPNDFMIALSDHLARKCQYGQDMSALSEPERTIFITQSLELEVNNGGFSQFFYNSGGDFTAELVAAFTAIGAERTAAICRQAIVAFGQELPADRDARLALLDACESDELDEALAECDNAFYEYQDDLNALNHAYVLLHREFFH